MILIAATFYKAILIYFPNPELYRSVRLHRSYYIKVFLIEIIDFGLSVISLQRSYTR